MGQLHSTAEYVSCGTLSEYCDPSEGFRPVMRPAAPSSPPPERAAPPRGARAQPVHSPVHNPQVSDCVRPITVGLMG